MTRYAINGISLNADIQGNGFPLLLLHGFTGSSRTWQPHVSCWNPFFRTITVDLIGHGDSDSPHDADRYRMEACVADLLELMNQLQIDRFGLLGYSMGGRVALQLANAAPERVAALVLESASPGIADAAERKARIANDNALADRIERDGILPFIDYWQSIPLFQSQQKLPEDIRKGLREQRLRNSPAGLANSLRGMGTGMQSPLHDRLQELDMPVLLIAGEWDDKYVSIGHKMNNRLPRSRLEVVPNAGHTVHLEQPDVFDELVLEFFQSNIQGKRKGS
ncbi:2-succinyl-6-hydroxy-2,4-cyclohexadiene-1-carboxylate synthase [Effusibacillus dendaii]|uniref:Putative 2-succinyl-6-hydroxy-2,4-cyclohexadiene-1-carboxylate synthase n=1 Tax=Effusibacillus dendaii TaxID=2743772 RepID=A0A7I8DBH1_9BACL|nr:2-succinyl-6-hydroxy-2,4-cyclohexadiene-1-carboxylate synthase [Effusibacillus dendaii]BCJ86309.1 putative 2-succinyl-6-hydroxy-2,4-cyclohexadiene-1-carboxylate synthase [Effusibacillus dendaii]